MLDERKEPKVRTGKSNKLIFPPLEKQQIKHSQKFSHVNEFNDILKVEVPLRGLLLNGALKDYSSLLS